MSNGNDNDDPREASSYSGAACIANLSASRTKVAADYAHFLVEARGMVGEILARMGEYGQLLQFPHRPMLRFVCRNWGLLRKQKSVANYFVEWRRRFLKLRRICCANQPHVLPIDHAPTTPK